MAFMQVDFFSKILHMEVSVDVIIPQAVTHEIGLDSREVKEGRHPVLWLLHGATDDHTTWQRRTSIERYAAERGLAVVMPAAQLSAYTNMARGGDYYHFIAEELPEVMRGFFALSDKWEDNFIAGNSMGGAGALKIGINYPDRYSAIGCFSAGCGNGRPFENAKGLFDDKTWDDLNYTRYGDQDLKNTYEDTFYMAEKNKDLPRLPRIYHTCGTEDFRINLAREMRDFFQGMQGDPYHYVYEEHPGVHGWEYWDKYVTDFLEFLNLGVSQNEFTN